VAEVLSEVATSLTEDGVTLAANEVAITTVVPSVLTSVLLPPVLIVLPVVVILTEEVRWS